MTVRTGAGIGGKVVITREGIGRVGGDDKEAIEMQMLYLLWVELLGERRDTEKRTGEDLA